MTYLNDILFALYVVVVAATIITLLMENRQPVKMMAWLLVLIFLPVLGIIIYIFFGQNIRKERIVSQHTMDQLTKHSMLEFVEQRNLVLPEQHRSLLSLFTNQSLALPFKDNEVEIYHNGYEFFPALLHEIACARHFIHIDTYLIEEDPLGNLVVDALIDKVREGVEVRLIYDDVGCWKVKNRFFDHMAAHGIEVKPFLPVRFAALARRVNYRNHRKIIVIDGTVGFIGGMNIALRYVKGTSRQPWRDTHLKICGSAVYGLQRAFLVDWYFVTNHLLTNHKYYPTNFAPENDCIIQIVTSDPTSPWPDIEQGYVRILLAAKKYVYMESPYFLPTEPILFAMRTAALSGVDVRLMIPLKGDSKLVEWASRTYVKETVDAGVKILLYTAGFNHSKLLISDDNLASCGSANLDFRSFEDDFESNAFIYDEGVAMRLKAVFLDDELHSISLDDATFFSRIPFLQRLRDSLVRLLAPLM